MCVLCVNAIIKVMSVVHLSKYMETYALNIEYYKMFSKLSTWLNKFINYAS